MVCVFLQWQAISLTVIEKVQISANFHLSLIETACMNIHTSEKVNYNIHGENKAARLELNER